MSQLTKNVSQPVYVPPHQVTKGQPLPIAANDGLSFAGAYGPSKACVEAQVLSWAEETAGTGVTVNCLGPGGAVNTRFGRGEIRDRGLDADVMNKMALWLASDQSGDYNGCRFTGKYWDDALSNAEAAEKCRDAPLFPVPCSKPTKLDRAWRDSERAVAGTQTEG